MAGSPFSQQSWIFQACRVSQKKSKRGHTRFEEYAGVKHGEVFIHLSQNHPHWRPPGSGAIYIYCDDVDDFYAQIKAKGCETQNEPQDWPYEMRDFMAFDVDGNQITFGHETSKG